MDWDKAKTHLITFLAILNIILIVSIMSHNNAVSIDNIYFSKKSLIDLQTVLDRKNIKITTELPKEINRVGTMNVEYETLNAESYPKLFKTFDDQIYVNALKKLVLELDNISINSLSEAENFSNKFLAKYIPDKEFSLRNYSLGNGAIKLYFNPIYDDFIFEESSVRFEFSENKLKVVMIIMRPLETSASKRDSITSVEAVLKAFPSMENDSIINRIDFMYYFDSNSADNLYKLKNARAFPCWRIMTTSNKIYYIPAIEN